jgi:arylsulfatase
VIVPAQVIVRQHLASFAQFPLRRRPDSFSVEQAMEKLRLPASSNWRNRERLILSWENSAEIA